MQAVQAMACPPGGKSMAWLVGLAPVQSAPVSDLPETELTPGAHAMVSQPQKNETNGHLKSWKCSKISGIEAVLKAEFGSSDQLHAISIHFHDFKKLHTYVLTAFIGPGASKGIVSSAAFASRSPHLRWASTSRGTKPQRWHHELSSIRGSVHVDSKCPMRSGRHDGHHEITFHSSDASPPLPGP